MRTSTKYFDLAPDDTDDVRREKVLAKSLAIDGELAEIVPYICFLLGVSGPEDVKLRPYAGEVMQRLMLDAVERLLVAESSRAPLAIIFEDIHWMDSKTEEFLVAFGQHLAAHRILLLTNYRPKYQFPLQDCDNFTEINLDPLTSDATESLLSSMLGDAPQLESVKHLVQELTEGNPFFAEELVRDLQDKGVLKHDNSGNFTVSEPPNGLHSMKVPTTLQGVLASRIDALAPSYKELLQRLSIFGREFPLELVQPFADRAQAELERGLGQLQQYGFVSSPTSGDTTVFKFKHSLTQQVAYNSMTAERRKALHERAGTTIEKVFASRLQDHVAELAYHYSRSANADKAIDYLGRAGNQAVLIAAHRQAVVHFEEGLSLLRSLPTTPALEAKELNLRFSLAATLWQSDGPANDKLQAQLNRVVALVKPETDPFLSFGVLQASVLLSSANAEYSEALRRCDRLASFAQQLNSPLSTMLSSFVRSSVLMLAGELESARSDLEEAYAAYQPLQSVLPDGAMNIAVQSLALYGPLLSILGFPDRAAEISEYTIATARSHSTKYYLAYAIYFAGFVRLMRGDVIGAERFADESIAVASEYGFPTVLGGAKVLRGWSLAHAGEFDDGLKMIREGIDEFERSTGKVWHATLNGILLEVLILAGRLGEAASLAGETIQFAEASGERFTLAELWRAKGHICLATDNDQKEAEKCFQRSRMVAQEQGARLFELRASTSLASLLSDTGRRDEARAILSVN